MSHECQYCGHEFQTRDQLRDHQSKGYPGERLTHEGGGLDPNLPMPDFTDPFAPDPESEQDLHCLQCEMAFSEAEVIYDDRHGQRLWWCPNQRCDGRGVGVDLVPIDQQTPTEGPVAPDRTDVPRGYRKKTIPPATLPPHWHSESEERNQDEIINQYHHEHLDLRVNLTGVRITTPGPLEYDISITAPADAVPATGYDTFLETTTDITDFEPARDTARELMEHVDQGAHEAATPVVQTALAQMAPEYQQQPDADDLSTDPDHDCPTCGIDTDIYRGNSPGERLQAHRTHISDNRHAE